MVVLWYHTDVNMQQLNPPIPDHLMVLPNQIDRQFTANAHGEDDSTPKTAHMIRGPSTTKTKTAAPTRSASNTFSASAVLPTLNNESLAKELDHTLGKFAYGFVISACTKHSCLGYILNIITASHVLKQSGSKADIVLQVKMNSNTNGTMLAPEQELWIKKADVILKYTEKTRHDNFGLATIEKYRVLEWLEYDRVLFLDADILPLCNMDYLFVDSFNPDGALGELVSIQGAVAPMTASALLVTPKPGEFDSVLDIIRRHRNRKDNATIFDPTIGWGHEMKARDMWMAWSKMGNNWNFYAASADQVWCIFFD